MKEKYQLNFIIISFLAAALFSCINLFYYFNELLHQKKKEAEKMEKFLSNKIDKENEFFKVIPTELKEMIINMLPIKERANLSFCSKAYRFCSNAVIKKMSIAK